MMPSDNRKILFQYLFLIVLIFSLFPGNFFNQPVVGLDASWCIALHLAHKYQLVFGKDFVFTYGPLGVLVSRLPITINLYFYLLFDLYFLGSLFFLLKYIIKKHFSYGMMFFVFLSFVTALYQPVDLLFFLLFLFYLFAFLKEPGKWGYLIQAGLLSIIGFFIKVSAGPVEIFFFLISMTYLLLRKNIRIITYLAIGVIYVLAIWIAARMLRVDLPGYILSSSHIIDGYNDAMFLPLGEDKRSFGYAALFIFLVFGWWIGHLFWLTFSEKKVWRDADELFICLVVILSVFILFKAAFVRADAHIIAFFKNIAFIAGLLYLFCPLSLNRRVAAFYSVIILMATMLTVNKISGTYRPYKELLVFSFFQTRIRECQHYIEQIGSYNEELANSQKLDSANNPFKQIIGQQTVDVVPSEISKIYFNGLHYNPRPVMQSYSAYDGYLDNLNYQKYISGSAPDYILFSTNCLEDRYVFFDESKTKMAILNNYKIIGKLDGELILKRNPGPSVSVKPVRTDVVHARLGEEIPISKGEDLQFSQIFVDYSLKGKIRRILYQPEKLLIRFTLQDGTTKTFRAIKPILEGGVLVNRLIDNDIAFQLFMQMNGRLNPAVKSIRFESASGNGSGFQDEIRMVSSYYPEREKSPFERVADTLAVKFVEDQFVPILANASMCDEDGSIQNFIESYSNDSLFVSLSGWGFRSKGNNEHRNVSAVLRSDKGMTYLMPTAVHPRPDLSSYFQRPDIDNAGFSADISKFSLPPGQYQVGISVLDYDSSKRWVVYTGNRIQIKSSVSSRGRVDSSGLLSAEKKMAVAVDTIGSSSGKFIALGWAYDANTDSRDIETNLLLKDVRGKIFKIRMTKTERHDVSLFFSRNPKMEYCGFSLEMSVSDMPKGRFTVGIEEVNAETGERGWTFTGKQVTIGGK